MGIARVIVEPAIAEGCERCEGTGTELSDQLDREGIWFRLQPCSACAGSLTEHCSSPGCERPASRVVRAGDWQRYVCDCDGCAVRVFEQVLRSQP